MEFPKLHKKEIECLQLLLHKKNISNTEFYKKHKVASDKTVKKYINRLLYKQLVFQVPFEPSGLGLVGPKIKYFEISPLGIIVALSNSEIEKWLIKSEEEGINNFLTMCDTHGEKFPLIFKKIHLYQKAGCLEIIIDRIFQQAKIFALFFNNSLSYMDSVHPDIPVSKMKKEMNETIENQFDDFPKIITHILEDMDQALHPLIVEKFTEHVFTPTFTYFQLFHQIDEDLTLLKKIYIDKDTNQLVNRSAQFYITELKELIEEFKMIAS